MEQFYKDFGFILGFLVCIVIINTAFGSGISEKFLIVVLLSMCILNYEKFTSFLGNIFTLKED